MEKSVYVVLIRFNAKTMHVRFAQHFCLFYELLFLGSHLEDLLHLVAFYD